jgi:hypothetical protein
LSKEGNGEEMNILSKIYRAIRIAKNWDRAVTFAATGRYESALLELEIAWKYWENHPPPKYPLLRAYVESRFGHC